MRLLIIYMEIEIMMTKFDAIIKMAEISCKNTCADCGEEFGLCKTWCADENHCRWHKVRNETLRRMRFYFKVSPFGLAPKKILKLSNRIADAIVFDGEHFPLVFTSSETCRKSAIRDCRRQFKKLHEKGAYAWEDK